MSLEVLFGILLLALIAVWGIWMVAIADGRRVGAIIGVPIILAALLAMTVLANNERSEQKREDYRGQIERFIEAVVASQDQAIAQTGAASDEMPDLDDELLEYDGGLLQEEETLEPSLSADKQGYTVSGTLGDQTYTLEVKSAQGGGSEEIRTCSALESAGCVDGSWEPRD